MDGNDAVRSGLRSQAKNIGEAAQGEAVSARLRKEHAECGRRNRAKLIRVRLQQTTDEQKRRQILRQSLLGAGPRHATPTAAASRGVCLGVQFLHA
jgi:hypothetical protein